MFYTVPSILVAEPVNPAPCTITPTDSLIRCLIKDDRTTRRIEMLLTNVAPTDGSQRTGNIPTGGV